MPLSFDLKHAIYGAAGAAIGALMGYLFGFVLYVVVLSASAFGPTTGSTSGAISTMSSNAGLFPLIFAGILAALGFFSGYYVSSKNEEAKPSA